MSAVLNTRRNLRSIVLTVGLAAVLSVAASPAAHAQKGAKKPAPPAKKPPVAPAVNKGPIVLGTTQLPGDFGKLGQTYTIGKREPINFTLDSVRYTADRFTVGNNTWTPKADEKLMILRYTVHNPLPKVQNYSWGQLKFTAVDAADTNREYIQAVRRAGVIDSGFNADLKPAQKVQIEAAILVPASGVVPKLIVQRENDAPVIRYDLRGKVEKLPTPYADPADAEGATALKEVPVKAGEVGSLGPFDIKLESVAYTDESLGGREVKKGYRNVSAVFTIKNVAASKQRYYWGDFDVTGRDAEGEKVPYTQAMLKPSRNEKTDGDLEPGEEVRVRFYFPVPKEVSAKTMALKDLRTSGRDGRALVFDLTSAPAGQATASAQ
jgi:hypothetical protein